MKRIDKEHYKVCLINNQDLYSKIDSLIFDTFNKYCNKKKINYSFNDSIKSIDSINNLIKLDSLNADLFFSRSNFFINISKIF